MWRLPALLLFASALAGLAEEGRPPLESLDLAPALAEKQPVPKAVVIGGDRAPVRPGGFNGAVLEAVHAMPHGGGYASTGQAMSALALAIRLDPTGSLLLRPELAQPSFCSGATYLVFLSALDRLNQEGSIHLTRDVLEALQMRRQADGTGLWGRWNANGPGTARLFHELALGRNFTVFEEAQAGDFLKLWWNDEVGAREHGHSVIYMGSSSQNGQPAVTFWSANVPGGFGLETVPRTKIHRALFSRLQAPQAIEHAATLPAKDNYLADMLRRGSTDDELAHMVGLPAGEGGRLKAK